MFAFNPSMIHSTFPKTYHCYFWIILFLLSSKPVSPTAFCVSSLRSSVKSESCSVLSDCLRPPSPGALPKPGIKPGSPALQENSLSAELPGKPQKSWRFFLKLHKPHTELFPLLTCWALDSSSLHSSQPNSSCQEPECHLHDSSCSLTGEFSPDTPLQSRVLLKLRI